MAVKVQMKNGKFLSVLKFLLVLFFRGLFFPIILIIFHFAEAQAHSDLFVANRSCKSATGGLIAPKELSLF